MACCWWRLRNIGAWIRVAAREKYPPAFFFILADAAGSVAGPGCLADSSLVAGAAQRAGWSDPLAVSSVKTSARWLVSDPSRVSDYAGWHYRFFPATIGP